MHKKVLRSFYNSHQWQHIATDIDENQKPLGVFGLIDNQKPMLYSAISGTVDSSIIIVVSDYIRAAQLQKELSTIDEMGSYLLFPHRPTRLGNIMALSHDDEHDRIRVLSALLGGDKHIVIATIESLMTKIVTRTVFEQSMIDIDMGNEYTIELLSKSLANIGYTRCDRVESRGQYAIRGDLLDIYSVVDEYATRVEFFGDTVDSIRTFDATTQRSIENIDSITVVPAIEIPLSDKVIDRGEARLQELSRKQSHIDDQGNAQSHNSGLMEYIDAICEELRENRHFDNIDTFFDVFYTQYANVYDYMSQPLIVLDDPIRLSQRNESILTEHTTMYHNALENDKALHVQKDLLLDFNQIIGILSKSKMITLNNLQTVDSINIDKVVRYDSAEPPVYKGKFDLLKADIKRWRQQEYNVLFMVGDQKRGRRLEETLSDFEIYLPMIVDDRDLNKKEAAIIPAYYPKGFECSESNLVVITEYELYGVNRYKSKKSVHKSKKVEVFNDLEVGDYAVHDTHGIGVYDGVVSIETNEHTRDYLKIIYHDDNVLYVPVEQMDRVGKYVGKDGVRPKISRLGGSHWQKAKAKVRATVKELAEDLVALYATREKTKGYIFQEDDHWQKQFEEQFPYDETPDQITCIEDIKSDMQSDKIMDRLLCGDVGYGKTEVALRGVFKAVMSGKQAAILCPTTILAHQHYLTMQKRFGSYPITYCELSRFLTKKQQDKVIADLAKGKIDVVVGTHRLLSQDIKFEDLGLLVVDEEQRFGVGHKEKIKHMREKVDVLTLTATPIPRTLHMSLSGIRDISILDTPPEERHPVQTFVIEYKESLIRNAIIKEIERGGKVFFLYNRVASIEAMADRIRALVPESRVGIAHGQMHEHKLEDTMIGFIGDEYNVLVCTTIIESGLDIPSANTLIVYDSDKFGLAQLYQIKGRVGRSNRLAYAYFTWREGKVLTEIADKRLSAIAKFTEFGSGLKIAMRDLEIRGAGDLLGARQHGHMAVVGYGMYCKMIEEAIKEVKGEKKAIQEKIDVTLSLNISANIPHEYIAEQINRLDAYKKISYIQSKADISEVLDELVDRYGDPPKPVQNLLNVSYTKHLAQSVGISLIRQTEGSILLRFSHETNVDGVALFHLVNRYDGKLRISNKEYVTLKYLVNNCRLDMLVELLTDILETNNK